MASVSSSSRMESFTANTAACNILPVSSSKRNMMPILSSFCPSSLLKTHRVRHPASMAVSANLSPSAVEEPQVIDETLPTPIVIIDQESDPDATVVELSFGDRLGALLDTMKALKELGLDVIKSSISVDGSIGRKRFSITQLDTGRKIEDPETLEAIRLTIIRNMLEYHPESSALLAMGNAFGISLPAELDLDISTRIRITEEGPRQSLLHIKTADRPGLLRDIVKILTDTNVTFQSGEFDTEGLLAKAKFHVNYRGAALNKPMRQAITNSIHYFLRRPETNEDSY